MALVVPALGWVAVAVTSYLALPLYGHLLRSTWAWPLILVGLGPIEVCWLLAGFGSIFAIILMGIRRAKRWAVVVALGMFVDSQFQLPYTATVAIERGILPSGR